MENNFEIRKADRKQIKLRIGMFGPTGCGKTYSALLLARGMTTSWDKVFIIDTENGRGELYSDLGQYNYLKLEAPFQPEKFIRAIEACEQAGAEVIVVDSITHEWDGKGGCLQLNELLAQSKYKGNTWAAWSEVTPRHQAFIEKIISSPCHIISTARSKMETIMTEDKKVKKIGLKAIQREGFEYELTVSFDIDIDAHMATVTKDNTHIFEGRDPFLITKEDGKLLVEWNKTGREKTREEKKKEIKSNLARLGLVHVLKTKEDVYRYVFTLTGLKLEDKNHDEIISSLQKYDLDKAGEIIENGGVPPVEEKKVAKTSKDKK